MHELLHGSAPADQKMRRTIARCGAPRERQVASAGEDTIFRTDGTAIPAEYFLTPILDQGRFSGSVLSFRDISQRYALDRLKDEFISTVSHELRTPLTSIRGALGLLSSGILGDINDKAANLLAHRGDQLRPARPPDQRHSRPGAHPERTRAHHVPPDAACARWCARRSTACSRWPTRPACSCIHDTTQVEISGDPDRLLQVLTNLLSNAIKFSPPNSAVSVMMRPGPSGVTLSVIDQGRGIPADKLEAIFGRFQQVDASDSRQKGGSGLGLAICRTIVLQHSGRIWAERNPVRGSTFRVFLPYQARCRLCRNRGVRAPDRGPCCWPMPTE